MKKILLGTTAIIGASVLLASAAQAADKPELKIDGFMRFQMWQLDQDYNLNSSGASNNQGTAFEIDDAEIHFTAKQVADNGLEYGAYIEIQEGGSDSKIGYDEANVFFAGDWGRLEMGSQDAVYNNFKGGAWAITADKDGAWDGDNIFNRGTNNALGSTDLFGGDDANKVSYYTPTFSGFTAGVSFAPNTNSQFNSNNLGEVSDDGSDFLTGGNGNMNNQVGGAIRYANTFGDFGVKANVRYARADYQGTKDRDDASAYGVDAVVTYAGFSLAGSFMDAGDSGLTTSQQNAGGDAGQWWDVGLAYGTGPYSVSIAYAEFEANEGAGNGDDTLDYLAIGGNYAVTPGLDIYTEYQYVDMDGAAESDRNEANVFLVGTQVSF